MTTPEWLKAKIHTDNGSQVYGKYRSVEMGGGSFSVHDQNRIKNKRTKVLVLGAVGLTISETSRALSATLPSIKAHRARIFTELESNSMIHAVTRSFARGLFQIEQEAELPDKGEVDMDFLAAIAGGMPYREYAQQASLDLEEIKAMCADAEDKFDQHNMAGVVTLAHLARIL